MLSKPRKRCDSRRLACCTLFLLAATPAVQAQRAYISGEPIVVYDTSGATPAPLGNIDTGYTVQNLALSPDGATLYAVAAQANAGYLLLLNPRATDANPNPPQAILGKVAIGSAPFGGMALSGDGKTVYVANFGEGSVYVVDVSGAVPVLKSDVPLCAGASGVALSPDGTVLYVACRTASEIGVIGTTGLSAGILPVTLGGAPDQLAVSAAALYMTYPGNAGIGSISGPVPATIATLPSSATDIAVSNDGNTLYAALFRGMNTIGGFVAIDVSKNPATVGTPIDVGQNPLGVTLSADGGTAYVVNTNPDAAGSVSVVDLASFKVTATLAAGAYTSHIAVGAAPPPASAAPAPALTVPALLLLGGLLASVALQRRATPGKPEP